jgi:anti-anti-sigma regulatory factor
LTSLNDYIEAVFNTVREPLLLLSPDLRVKQANRSFYELFSVSENETVGRFVSELATGPWAVSDWAQLGKFLARQSNSEYFTLEVEFPSIGRRRMRVNARPVQLPREEELTLLMALEDITSSEDLARGQQRLIQQLSSPVLPFQNQVLLVPIIGTLNLERMGQLKEKLLESIRRNRAKVVILDITGVKIEPESEGVAEGFREALQTSKLLGATIILTGISSETAQSLVELAVDRSTASSVGDLERGLDEADRILGYQRISISELNALREELRLAKHKLDALQKKQPNTLALPAKAGK